VPVFFPTKPGVVAQLLDPAVQCAARLTGVEPEIDFTIQRSIITRLTLGHQVNVQFLHTLGSQVYIYVFGDRIGQVGLSGLSFRCNCFGEEIGSPFHGAELIYNWYRDNRASRRQEPVLVNVGTEVLEGFVTGFSEDVVDPSLEMVQWNVTMMTLPEDETS
jgi:hypothetical protein